MKDFNYEKGSELDNRLDKVMETHRAQTTTKVSSTTAETQSSSLQAFVQRPTIAEEIAEIEVSKVAHFDVNEELAREQIDGILEGRSSKLSNFHEAVMAATAEAAAVDPVKVASDLIRSGVDPQEAARRALA